MGRALVWCSAALTLAGGVRQKVGSESSASAAQVVDSIGELLQRQHADIRKISESVDAKALTTPGAADSFSTGLKSVIDQIEAGVEAKIKAGQKATQDKIDAKVLAVRNGKSAVDADKQAADAKFSEWVACIADQKTKKQASEDAQGNLTAAQATEKAACDLQAANSGYKWDTDESAYKLAFTCDESVENNCQSQLTGYKKDPLRKILQDATASMKAKQEKYNELTADAEAKKMATIAAQAAKEAADKALADQKAACGVTKKASVEGICKYGKNVQAKCVAETHYKAFLEFTQIKSEHYSKINPVQLFVGSHEDSEVDRIEEWSTSKQTRCMLEASVKKGLGASLGKEDVAACASQVDFAAQVGNLDKKSGELAKLAGACSADQKISFGDGEAWEVPDGAKAADYAKKQFALPLNPEDGSVPFAVCGSDGVISALSHTWPFSAR